MEYEIFDIVTDLLREDITKMEAIDKLLFLHSVVGSALLKDLLDESREVIAVNGLRFTGTHEEKIKQVFEKYGIKYELPF